MIPPLRLSALFHPSLWGLQGAATSLRPEGMVYRCFSALYSNAEGAARACLWCIFNGDDRVHLAAISHKGIFVFARLWALACYLFQALLAVVLPSMLALQLSTPSPSSPLQSPPSRRPPPAKSTGFQHPCSEFFWFFLTYLCTGEPGCSQVIHPPEVSQYSAL